MRVKRGTNRAKKRKNILKKTKGYINRRSNTVKGSKEAALHAGKHAHSGRRIKKRDMRAHWIVRLNAAARLRGMSYSELIERLNKADVKINRKLLSEIALNEPDVFDSIIKDI